MPAPAKTSAEAIERAALRLVERKGIDGLSMHAVAKAVGIKAPSLYKHHADRETLLDAVTTLALDRLERLLTSCHGGTPRKDLLAMAHTVRAFSRESPHLYALLFSRPARDDAGVAQRRQAIAPLFERLAKLVPAADLLPTARLLTAYLHGFITMEIGGMFQLGGNLDRSFEQGLRKILA